jgi:hypothetical protein
MARTKQEKEAGTSTPVRRHVTVPGVDRPRMGHLVIAEPGKPAGRISHDGPVLMEMVNQLIGTEWVDVIELGRAASGRAVVIFFDDNGLLRDDALPNRQLPGGVVLAGTIVACASEDGNTVALTDIEAVQALSEIEKWAILPADHPKPKPLLKALFHTDKKKQGDGGVN